MQIVVGKKLVNTGMSTLARLTLAELEAYEAFLWECLEKLPHSPTIVTTMNAIYREVEYRAQDT